MIEGSPPVSTQNTVPSLSISIGGPPVSGRNFFAISRPPFHVALSKIWAKVSVASGVAPTFCRIRPAIRSLTTHQMSARLHQKLTRSGRSPLVTDSAREAAAAPVKCHVRLGTRRDSHRLTEDENWTELGTYSSTTVMALHSTMAGCEGGSLGIGEPLFG
jgi:hypothetical protein